MYIADYKKGGVARSSFIDAGVSLWKRSVVKLIGSGPCSLEEEIYPKLIRKRGLVAHIICKRFYDIGTPQRLKIFERYQNKQNREA